MSQPKLIFIGLAEKGSFTYRARQIQPYINKLGLEAVCCSPYGALKIARKGDVAVYVKFYQGRSADRLKVMGCKIVFDIIDLFVSMQFRNMKIPPTIDGIIFPNTALLKERENRFPKTMLKTVIHHHIDPRLKKFQFNKFNIGYFGVVTDLGKVKMDKFGVDAIQADKAGEWINSLGDYSCHFSFRENWGKRSSVYKPSTKVVVASAVGANIVATKDAAFLDLLDNSYPYYCESVDHKVVIDTIHKARETYGKEEWNRGLSMLEEVRERTTPENIAKDFIKMFKELNP